MWVFGFCFLSFSFHIRVQLPHWLRGKESACQCRRLGFDPCMGTIPWRRKWQPTPVFWPGESPGQRSLVGDSPRGCRVRHDSATAKRPQWINNPVTAPGGPRRGSAMPIPVSILRPNPVPRPVAPTCISLALRDAQHRLRRLWAVCVASLPSQPTEEDTGRGCGRGSWPCGPARPGPRTTSTSGM